MGDRKAAPEYVDALARGLRVIEAFDESHPQMTLSEVARRTGMSPAAARRSLHTLAALGYLRHVGKRFLLSAHVLTLGASYLRTVHVEELLLPELRRLVGKFGDAASVTVLDGFDILYVAHYSEQRASRLIAGIGVTYPAFATSTGRVLMAGMSDDALARFLAGSRLEPRTENTVTDPGALRSIVRQARQSGYATAIDELDYGITALAVPIRSPAGTVVAALNSSGYTGRLDIATMIADRLPDLRESAARISQALARYPHLADVFAGAAPCTEAAGSPPSDAWRRPSAS